MITCSLIIYYRILFAKGVIGEAIMAGDAYKKEVVNFYKINGYCPVLVRDSTIKFNELLRLEEGDNKNNCLIVVKIRKKAPVVAEKLVILSVEFNKGKESGNWTCTTNTNFLYRPANCNDEKLPNKYK